MAHDPTRLNCYDRLVTEPQQGIPQGFDHALARPVRAWPRPEGWPLSPAEAMASLLATAEVV
jgi:hypothetical protein